MNKSAFLLLLVGAGFIYLAIFLANDASKNINTYNDTSSISYKGYDDYIKKSASGDDVLDLSGLPLSKAKRIWAQSPIKDDVLDKLPDFDLAKQIVKNELADSSFKEYILKKLSDLGDKYLSGDIDLLKAKNIISNPQ